MQTMVVDACILRFLDAGSIPAASINKMITQIKNRDYTDGAVR